MRRNDRGIEIDEVLFHDCDDVVHGQSFARIHFETGFDESDMDVSLFVHISGTRVVAVDDA